VRREVLGRPVAPADRPPADEGVLVELGEQRRELRVLFLQQTNRVVAGGHAGILAGE
jgi:hypothetical protein